ncbi:TonB-dependent receptor [Rugamonas apoptosis]|uniref:TonB-dependent receptor plug domain-containing protein n=1 Tax=Rugamonas apoptosis TaxID=2758570 RepID=A0A7W2ILN5_9BURK|nr:TonB-dependent receptor [Rugamonas apoptosis]MBA5688667.1 TonB-dependent receptor plug domain-containing protein [Rugamonas apoptosis]
MKCKLKPLALACAALVQAGSLHAQDSAADKQADQGTLEAVTITAQRRSEVLSKAPLSVSVVSQKALDAQGITALVDIASSIPNMAVASNGFSMRGIGSNASFGGYSTVAVHVDGIYEPNYQIMSLGQYDVSRIEALRGPQGTVYGRNATVGVVNVITARPSARHELSGDAAYGEHNDVTVRGVLNVPVSDTLQLRAALLRRTSDGDEAGGAVSARYGKINLSSARLAAAWQLTDELKWNVSLSRLEDQGTISAIHSVAYNYYPDANIAAGTLGARVTLPVDRNVGGIGSGGAGTDIRKALTQSGLRSSLVWNLNDDWALTYLAGLTRLVNDGVDFNSGIFSYTNHDNQTRTQSHELNLNYEGDRLKLVGGLYAYRDKQSGLYAVRVGNALPAPLASVLPAGLAYAPGAGNLPSGYGDVDIAVRNNELRNTSKAVFGQATYSLTAAMRMTLGLRSTRDTALTNTDTQACLYGTLLSQANNLPCSVPFGAPVNAYGATSSRNTSYKVTSEFDLGRSSLLYATVATGYRGGGVTPNVASEYLTYKPETLTSFEAGWRGRLLRDTLGVNLTAFSMDYKDLQVSTIGKNLSGNNAAVTGNAATARVRGIETEVDWRITRSDQLQGFFTYLDARFGKVAPGIDNAHAIDSLYNNYAPTPINASPLDNSDRRLPNAPKFSARARYAHTYQLGAGGQLTPSIQSFWQSGSFAVIDNLSDPNPLLGYRKAYSKTDLNLDWQSADKRWTVNAHVYNLEDRQVYATSTQIAALSIATYMPRRTFGLRAGYSFY